MFQENGFTTGVDMYERFAPIINVTIPGYDGTITNVITASQRAVYRWSVINVVAARNWWRSLPQSMHHNHATT